MLAISLAFLAGIITILSPCVLPLLPVILAGAAGDGAARPLGIVAGFVGAFTIATLGLATAVSALGLPPDVQRLASVAVLAVLGFLMLVPKLKFWFESVTSGWVGVSSGGDRGFLGGVALGAGLGLAWTPCVGPIMASVITLALSQQISGIVVLTTLAFALGTALPMIAIITGGRRLVLRLKWFQVHGDAIQQVFGALLIATAAAIWFGVDRDVQVWLLDWLPQWEQALQRW